MKNILLLTTSFTLVYGASFGNSHDNVVLSGYAELGVKGGNTIETQFHSDFEIDFILRGATDNGISFGASMKIEEAAYGVETDIKDGYSVYVKSNYGMLVIGDTDGALDARVRDVGLLSSIADNHTDHAGYNDNSGLDGLLGVRADNDNNPATGDVEIADGQIWRYDYSIGGFAISASAELDDKQDLTLGGPQLDHSNIYGVGVSWDGSVWAAKIGVGLGYQTTTVIFDGGVREIDVIGASLSGGVAGVDLVVNYSQMGFSNYGKVQHIGVGASYALKGASLSANWGQYNFSNTSSTNTGWGIAANYDLGGGAIVKAGYGTGLKLVDIPTQAVDLGATTSNSWSFGVGLSF